MSEYNIKFITFIYNAAEEINVTNKMQPMCNTGGEPKTEFCEIKMEVRIDGNSSSVFTVSSQTGNTSSWSIKPYPRKQDPTAMSKVKSWSVKSVLSNQEIPKCTKVHNVPAVLFSLPRFVGNIFHDFTEVLIPLYITSQQYNGDVQFLASEKPQWWIEKFQEVLKGLTKYEIMDIDKEIEEVHCFPSSTIGLKRDTREFIIDPLKHSCSMRDFRVLIRNGYSLKRAKAIKLKEDQQKKPRLLIISRRRTRSFMNMEEISKMARSLGYEVIVTEADKNLTKFAELVNSCDVFMGVHGAGLTNMVFLPENAILIQIVPYGLFQWIATIDYGDPEKDMNIKYLQYDSGENESTLIKKYPPDHAVFTDPSSIWEQGWDAYRAVYLDQNVNLDVNRFRLTLLKAFDLLRDDQ